MIDLRELARKQGGFLKVLSNYSFLWDNFTQQPDVFCSSILDYKNNFEQLNKRSVLLRRVQYKENNDFTIFYFEDPTGILEIIPTSNIKKRLKQINKGAFLYDFYTTFENGKVILRDFTNSPNTKDKISDKEYLSLKFPSLANSF